MSGIVTDDPSRYIHHGFMRARNLVLLPFALAVLLAGCDVPSSLLSDEERNSLYSVDISQGSRGLNAGDAVAPGSSIAVSVGALSGSKPPDSLSLDLVDSTGLKVASLAFASPTSSRTLDASQTLVPVVSVVGKLPDFTIPDGLEPGFYSLKTSIYVGNSGAQQSSFDFFVASDSFELSGVTFSPSIPRAGDGILLTAMIVPLEAPTASQTTSIATSAAAVTTPAPASTTAATSTAATSTADDQTASAATVSTSTDTSAGAATSPVAASSTSATTMTEASSASTPATASNPSSVGNPAPESRDRLWLRWTQGGRVIAEGPASSGFDQIVWQVPEREGAYTVRVDFYPGPPPGSSYSMASPWNQTISFVAKPAVPDKFKDPFTSASRFRSLFTFEGGISDTGSRPAPKPATIIGNPSLVPIPGGYGEHFDASDGFTTSGIGFDADSHDGEYSILMRVSIEGSAGTLLSLSSGAGSLALGLDGGSLWLAYPNSGITRKVFPGIVPGKGIHDLMLSFSPAKDGVSILWSFDDEPRTVTLVPTFDERFDELAVGGDSSVSATWEALGFCYDDAEPPPSLFASSLFRIEGERVIVAEGFESGPGNDLVATGSTTSRPFSLSLGPGSTLGTAADLPTAGGLDFAVGLRSGTATLVLKAPDGTVLLSITAEGRVRDASGNLLASIPEDKRRLVVEISKGDSGIEIRGASDSAKSLDLTLPQDLRAFVAGDPTATVESFVVASSPDA